MSEPPSGPAWNVEDLPSSYNGVPILWDPRTYDTVAMPFIVAVKHNFWSWRITKFEVRGASLGIEVALPSVLSDGMSVISLQGGDVSPEDAHAELADLLIPMGAVLLDSPWDYRLGMTEGRRRAEFSGRIGPSPDAV